MAFTGFVNRCLHYQKVVKGLLTKRNPLIQHSHGKSDLIPFSPFTEPPGLFTLTQIKEYPELITMVVICGVGFVAEVATIVRNWLTRDDIRWWSTMAYQRDEADIIAGKPPTVRKLMVIKQKYEWPEGLVKAYRGEPDDNANDKCKDKKKKK